VGECFRKEKKMKKNEEGKRGRRRKKAVALGFSTRCSYF